MSSSLLFRRTANGDLYPIHLGAILQHGLRAWDPSYSLSKDPEIWEKAQQDAVVSGAIERSLLETAGHDWGLNPFSDDPADVALASILEDVIRRTPRFYESRRNLAEARFVGSAFARITGTFRKAKIHDGKTRRWWIPGRLVDIDRRRLRAIAVRSRSTESGAPDHEAPYVLKWDLYSPARKRWEQLDPRFPIVRHVYADNESRLGYGRGIMDSIYFAIYIRTIAMKDGLQGLKRWAQGLLIGKVGLEAAGSTDQTNEEIRDELRDELLEMIGDNVLVISESDQVEVVTGGMEGHQIVDSILDRIEREILTRIEGTPISTMDGQGGGSRALGQEHGEREHFQRRFDRESLAESLTQDFVVTVHDLNRPTLREIDPRIAEANTPLFDIRDQREEDPKANSDVARTMVEVGAPPSKTEFYERVGWRKPEDDEEVIEAPEPEQGQGGGFPFDPSQMAAMLRAAADDALDRFMLRASVAANPTTEHVLRRREARGEEREYKRDEGGRFSTVDRPAAKKEKPLPRADIPSPTGTMPLHKGDVKPRGAPAKELSKEERQNALRVIAENFPELPTKAQHEVVEALNAGGMLAEAVKFLTNIGKVGETIADSVARRAGIPKEKAAFAAKVAAIGDVASAMTVGVPLGSLLLTAVATAKNPKAPIYAIKRGYQRWLVSRRKREREEEKKRGLRADGERGPVVARDPFPLIAW